ncbi:MAG: hypothetical protein NC293_05285 [Roseburia sp.]|nr:hypothetical protein [Roseburia sp.]
MSRAEITYTKREIKKVLPVLIVGVLYTIYMFVLLFFRLRDVCLNGYLAFSFPNYFQISELGDVFMYWWDACADEFHVYVIIFMEMFLIRRIFYQENRAGISDFLRTLPVKEWKKTWIKAGVGEATIVVFCLIHGLAACAVNSVYDKPIHEITSMIPGGVTGANTYFMIWKTIFLMFVGMSVMFFILFAAQLYIHNMVAAYLIGAGVLATPLYITTIYWSLYEDARHLGIGNIPASMLMPFPVFDMKDVAADMDTVSMASHVAYWDGYSGKLLFLFLFLIIAIAVILLALKKRWNVWESNNAVVNSRAVMQFIFSGISICFGTMVVMLFDDMLPVSGFEEFIFWLFSVAVAGVILLILNVVVAVMERKGKDRRKAG